MIREDWNEEKLKLCVPENFEVAIRCEYPILYEILNLEDRRRLLRALQRVEKIAKLLSANMLKGVLKYPEEDPALVGGHTTGYWLRYLVDDAADTLNYAMLALEAHHNDQQRSG